MNKHFISDELLNYCEIHSDVEPNYLQQLQRETFITQQQPHMISGHLQGRFLSFISKLIQPNYILEIGTYTGYATLCLAEGLSENGKIITIDCDAEKEFICKKYFELSPYHNQIQMIVGDAIKIIPTLENEIDLVFIDADKTNYINYFNLIFSKLKSGACVLVDNVLFNGEVLLDTKNKNAIVVNDFNKFILQNNEVEKVIVPLRDGIMMLRKK